MGACVGTQISDQVTRQTAVGGTNPDENIRTFQVFPAMSVYRAEIAAAALSQNATASTRPTGTIGRFASVDSTVKYSSTVTPTSSPMMSLSAYAYYRVSKRLMKE